MKLVMKRNSTDAYLLMLEEEQENCQLFRINIHLRWKILWQKKSQKVMRVIANQKPWVEL